MNCKSSNDFLLRAMKKYFSVYFQLQMTGVSHVIISFLCRQEMGTLERENQVQDKKSKSLFHDNFHTREVVNLNT